jgi:hypothetical protein
MNTKLVESLAQIIHSLDPEEQALFEEKMKKPQNDHRQEANQNLAEYAGVIQLTVDPLEYQQKIRDEYLSSAETEDSRQP